MDAAKVHAIGQILLAYLPDLDTLGAFARAARMPACPCCRFPLLEARLKLTEEEARTVFGAPEGTWAFHQDGRLMRGRWLAARGSRYEAEYYMRQANDIARQCPMARIIVLDHYLSRALCAFRDYATRDAWIRCKRSPRTAMQLSECEYDGIPGGSCRVRHPTYRSRFDMDERLIDSLYVFDLY